MEMKGLIVAGGPLVLAQVREELAQGYDLVVAADSGGEYLAKLEFTPQVLIGDFDSLTPERLAFLTTAGTRVVRYPEKKDQTDLELAMDTAIAAGVRDLTILGGLGGRMDHTLANIALLLHAVASHATARLLDVDQEIMLAGKRRILKARVGWGVSLIPLTYEVKGVTTSGLAYPLRGETLYCHATRGIHNSFVAPQAVIETTEGDLLVICFKQG